MRKAIITLCAFCVLAIVVIVTLVGYYFWSMTYRHVTESESWVTLDTARLQRKHLFEGFPATTKELRFSNSVVGMRGWCFVFAIRAPLGDLHAFANQELKRYSGKVVRTDDSAFPFDKNTPKHLLNGYSVNVKWLSKAENAMGVKYEVEASGGPTIFIDEVTETMYYVRTD